MSDEDIVVFHAFLLDWYSKNKRFFPWRYTFDPYKVLISEILLQQTNVKKIIQPYTSITSKYKNVYELADADIEFLREVFKDIGLFYRADRMIHICKELINRYNGNIPDEWNQLIEIRGIGSYISSAVLCFGYNKPYAVLDTNVIRVFERVLDVRTECSRAREDKRLWEFAQMLLPKDDYIDYNYALLDFGAEVCTAANPKCSKCTFKVTCYFYNSVKTT